MTGQPDRQFEPRNADAEYNSVRRRRGITVLIPRENSHVELN
jgi:hypothetical protein